MQVLPVSRIHSICQQTLGNFPRDNSAPLKGRSSTFETDHLGVHNSNLPGTLTLNTPNFVCCWSNFPRYRRWQEPELGGSTAGPFCAVLWPARSTRSKEELAQPRPGLRGRVPRAPSKAGLRLLTNPKEEALQQRECSTHGWHSRGEREKLKPRVVRRWGTVLTAREREEEVELWHKIVSLKVGSWERFLQEAQMGARLLEHLPVCRGWQNTVRHPTLASSPWQALQQK